MDEGISGRRADFLSSPSIRRATCRSGGAHDHQDLSILALHTEGDQLCRMYKSYTGLSILALHTEGDAAVVERHRFARLSILALHTEGDKPEDIIVFPYIAFYPRPPYGGRPNWLDRGMSVPGFLSSPSIRRATHGRPFRRLGAGSFYPRPPYGGRPHRPRTAAHALGLSILALHTEGDGSSKTVSVGNIAFYPRPPYGGRRLLYDIIDI